MPSHTDIYEITTRKIIAAIEDGAGKYQMPWNPHQCGGSDLTMPYNSIGGYAYRGINVVSLWIGQEAEKFPTAEWATYRQWLSVGAQVRKGEKSTTTVFFKPVDADEGQGTQTEDADNDTPRLRFIARAGHVFNAAQVDGYAPKPIPEILDAERHATADLLIRDSGASIVHGGPKACYVPSRDQIHLPPPGSFRDVEAYYCVAFHELTHWTGHKSRCDRDHRNRFGSEAYAMEELIAELGSAFLCARLGITPEPRQDHAQYIESWLKALRNDKRAIFMAASRASQATEFLWPETIAEAQQWAA